MTDPARPAKAFALAGGWCWFDRVEVLSRSAATRVIPAQDCPQDVLRRLTAPRADFAGLSMDSPRLMGILNVTPDSFSDGGSFGSVEAATKHGSEIARSANILDIGGESTRPGADPVADDTEIARTAPVILALRNAGLRGPISVDTRKATVATMAIRAGATLVNDVSGLEFDPALGPLIAQEGVPVVLMHSVGTPATMQDDPSYADVLLDVYDELARRLARAEAMGIPRSKIALDPGIGFGKTATHNLALIRRISLLHGLGCPILLGASRKRFIGSIGQAERPAARVPGSLAVALAGFAQGVQITRIHDVAETRQALRLWQAVQGDAPEEDPE